MESPQEREVFMSKSRTQRRNQRRRNKARNQAKIKLDQAHTPAKERLDASHPKVIEMRQSKGARRKPHPPSSQESEEEDNVQDTKVPKNKRKYQRK